MENKSKDDLIHEIEELKKELSTYQDNCARSEFLKNIDSLSVGIFHEINNPLSVLKSNLNLLKEEVEKSGRMDEKREKLFEMASRGINRMDRLSESLKRAIHGVSEESSENQIKRINLNSVIQDTFHFVKPTFKQLKIELR